MKEILLNNELALSYPEGFAGPSEEELAKLRFLNKKGAGEVLYDPERHMYATAAYQTIGGFQAMLLNIQDLGKNDAKVVAKAMEPYSCEMGEVETKTVAGEDAVSYSYHYTAEGKAMFGETTEIKKGKNIYYLHFYGRTDEEENCRSVIASVLSTAAFR